MSLSKSYIIFAIPKEGPYKTGNINTSFRIVKRTYKCIQAIYLKLDTHPSREWKNTRLYETSLNMKDASLSKVKSHAFISVSLSNLKERLNKKIHRKCYSWSTRKKEGITNAASASHIPTISQSYEITRHKNKTTSDTLTKTCWKTTKRWNDRRYSYTRSKNKSFDIWYSSL